MRSQATEKIFLEVYDEHADAIYRFCYFKLFDKEKAEELTQEAFMRTWEYLASGKEVDNLRAFVYRVARNSIVDYFRKKKELSLDDLHEQGFDASLEDAARWGDIIDGADAFQAIRLLDEKYREALLFRYADGLPVKEIASLCGESENVISVRLHRGLKQLKEVLRQAPRKENRPGTL
jgi:RNA polymerase sigma-70 factor (ECF subfamily)